MSHPYRFQKVSCSNCGREFGPGDHGYSPCDGHPSTLLFDDVGDFAACREAEAYCRRAGISVGEMCRDYPRGLLRGDYQIAKWRNLTAAERSACDGTMTGNMRQGPVTVTIKTFHRMSPHAPE